MSKSEEELIEQLKARLDQLTKGKRSKFEETLLLGLRQLWGEADPKDKANFAFVFEANPALTEKHANVILKEMWLSYAANKENHNLRDSYCEMRGALDLMLKKLPVVEDIRYRLPPETKPTKKP